MHWYCTDFMSEVFIALLVDKKTDAVVAKVAAYASDLYAEAQKLMQLNSIKDVWPRVRQCSKSMF